MNRFIFTSLIIEQLLILIHSNVPNENTYIYNEIYDESFIPTIVVREANEDDIKKSLGSPVINLADSSSATVEYYYHGKLFNTFEKKIYVELWKLCQMTVNTFQTELIDVR